MGRIVWSRNEDGSLRQALPLPDSPPAMFRMPHRTLIPSCRATLGTFSEKALGLLSLALLSACAATSSAAEVSETSAPARVRFMDYRQGTVFELVNEAHTDRVALYSEVRADTQTKVTSDEVMDALLEYLEDSGFRGQARSGVAPRTSDSYHWGGEIEAGGETVFLLVNNQTPQGERKMFIDCYMNHVSLWSNTFQLQRVDAGPGEVFKKPELRR